MKITMKNILSITIGLFLYVNAYSHDILNKNHIIELGKHYSRFMFANDASKDLIKNLGKDYDDNLANSVLFVKEVTKSNNKILSDKFLTLPDTNTLRVIYIIDALHQNPHLENPLDPTQVVDSLIDVDVPYHFLVDQYYQTIFTAVGNKNKPFDMSKVNFKMSEYKLNDEQKAIFYLRCMDACGSQIYGYMNIVNPPNTKTALEYINKFPKFDGLDYYQFTDLYFDDFQMEIFNDKGPQSYKSYFINKLFETLLNHAVCLSKEGNQQAVQDFLISSSLKDETLWKFTELQEVLKSIYKEE